MKLFSKMAVMLIAMTMSLSLMAQQMGGGGEQPDQVDQLAEMVDLTDEQQKEIRALLEDMEGDIESHQAEIQELQQKLEGHIKPDYSESDIREDSERLGELTGEMTALTVLLQAKVEGIFTEEQRKKLEEQMKQRQQQMQQMQQMQQQQQMQQ